MSYSPCSIMANFGHFQNAVIFRILGVFWSGFLYTTCLMWSYNCFSHLFGIFNFWPKLTIFCIVANFGHFKNAVIFRILGAFWSGFMLGTSLMWSYNRFWQLNAFFNFWPKLTILHGLWPMHRGQFWPLSKCCNFSNIRCFLERFFARNKFNVVVQSFLPL